MRRARVCGRRRGRREAAHDEVRAAAATRAPDRVPFGRRERDLPPSGCTRREDVKVEEVAGDRDLVGVVNINRRERGFEPTEVRRNHSEVTWFEIGVIRDVGRPREPVGRVGGGAREDARTVDMNLDRDRHREILDRDGDCRDSARTRRRDQAWADELTDRRAVESEGRLGGRVPFVIPHRDEGAERDLAGDV